MKLESLLDYLNEWELQATILVGYDDAVIGYHYPEDSEGWVQLVYDANKIIEILARDMEYDEAQDYFGFNVERGVLYNNEPHKPILVWTKV